MNSTLEGEEKVEGASQKLHVDEELKLSLHKWDSMRQKTSWRLGRCVWNNRGEAHHFSL